MEDRATSHGGVTCGGQSYITRGCYMSRIELRHRYLHLKAELQHRRTIHVKDRAIPEILHRHGKSASRRDFTSKTERHREMFHLQDKAMPHRDFVSRGYSIDFTSKEEAEQHHLKIVHVRTEQRHRDLTSNGQSNVTEI